jgi:hypothetical protein
VTIPEIAEADGVTFKLLGGKDDWNAVTASHRLRRMAFKPIEGHMLRVDTKTVARTRYYVEVAALNEKKPAEKPEEFEAQGTLRDDAPQF